MLNLYRIALSTGAAAPAAPAALAAPAPAAAAAPKPAPVAAAHSSATHAPAAAGAGLASQFGAEYYLKSAAAGGICCSITHGALCPVDVVKTRMQLDPVKYNKGLIGGFRQVR